MLKKISKWFVGAAAAVLMSHVYAQTPVLTSTPIVYNESVFASGPSVPTAFSKDFAFIISAPSSFSAVSTNFQFASIVNLSSLALQIFKGAVSLVGPVSAHPSPTSITLPLVSGTDYYARVSGVTSGSAGGGYSLALSATPVAPVPEPSEWMMMVAGLVVMGFIARRRKNIA